MSRIISRAESWERVYTAFQNINFAAFDYESIKQSLIDYVKLYFPETFNDYIESSEQIAIIETFAYIAEILAYRIDVNAHENYMSSAQRRDSILRLAKFISYSPSRPIPARGLVKFQTIQTTEPVLDSNGVNLSGTAVRWNDANNPNWKNQFILIMNRVLEQNFGSVRPTDRFQIQDVVFEIYGVNSNSLKSGVFPFTSNINGSTIPMEVVPVAYSKTEGIVERRPANHANFTLLYGSDGLGDGSDTTGFFGFVKQGTLRKITTTFDGVTPNQYFDVMTPNVNDVDVWLNNIDPTTGRLVDSVVTNIVGARSSLITSGEWEQVDLSHAQNVIFNTNPVRSKYEIETRAQNSIRILFGDGEFADIPSGTFDIWYRTSLDENVVIPQAGVVGEPMTISYVDDYGQSQTLTLTFSLVNTLQNASESESTEHIRNVAPAVYYTQDRMVNGQDYNTYMLQDPSIVKMRAVNRTFSGDSKYISWHDPSETYDNVKVFGDDGCMYFNTKKVVSTIDSEITDYTTLVSNHIQPLLSTTDIMMQLVSRGVAVDNVRRTFTTAETAAIRNLLETSTPPARLSFYYNTTTFGWSIISSQDDPSVVLGSSGWPASYVTVPLIEVEQTSAVTKTFNIMRRALRLIFESPTTKFWSTNKSDSVINFDTLTSDMDEIGILTANTNDTRTSVLKQKWSYNVLGLETVTDAPSLLGTTDVTRLSLTPADGNGDSIPDYVSVADWKNKSGIADFMMPKISVTVPANATSVNVQLPVPIVVGHSDLAVLPGSSINCTVDLSQYNDKLLNGLLNPDYNKTVTSLTLSVSKSDPSAISTFVLGVNEYVYFNRSSLTSPWYPKGSTTDNMQRWAEDQVSNGGADGFWSRKMGRSALNFVWMHATPRYYLVDPAPTNIIDAFLITKGYHDSMRRWLTGASPSRPNAPTPLDLRTSYGYMIDNKMMSDTVVLHTGNFKILFGQKAKPELRARFKVIVSDNKTMTDNQIKTTIVTAVRNFFDMAYWEFGETFYFTELSHIIHATLSSEISSVVLVPTYPTNQFGDLFAITCGEDEMFMPDITVNDIDIVTGYTPSNLRM